MNKQLCDKKMFTMLVLSAHFHEEISEERACELLGWPRERLRAETRLRIGSRELRQTENERLLAAITKLMLCLNDLSWQGLIPEEKRIEMLDIARMAEEEGRPA